MYKSYNFEPKSLSPHRARRNFNEGLGKKFNLNQMAERLVPFLIIATTFVWLWK